MPTHSVTCTDEVSGKGSASSSGSSQGTVASTHDLGVVARSLLTVVKMTAEYEARQGLDGAAAGHR
ncbi:hypothetical protein AB0G77_11250 [Streptomyces hygroscopicus]|uniref:hypothetical protein n=1 Tax=Streptomyces hygroscopicus TaxID=1912 RepID=UPI0033F431DB